MEFISDGLKQATGEKMKLIIDAFSKAGANGITFHIEASEKPDELIDKIKSKGKDVGISVKPQTALETILPFINKIDRVLIMSVERGFGGQKFIKSSLKKINTLRNLLIQNNRNNKVEIEVDGGIKIENAKSVINAGANAIVVGSGIFQASDPEKQIKAFKQLGN